MKKMFASDKNPNDCFETVYLAGGCLWGVQAFVKTLPGVIMTEAGRANGTSDKIDGDYDGYAECVKTIFDPKITSVTELTKHLFEIIDPYSVNKQGIDVGEKYRTGVYSEDSRHLEEALAFINNREDKEKIAVQVKVLTNYVKSAEEHQDRLDRCPNDYCHIPKELLKKYTVFREMRRNKQLLSEQETIEILKKGTSGVLALLGNEEYPYAVPLSYIYCDSKLYFHGAKSGHKIDAIKNHAKASFCVIEQDQVVPEEYTTYFRSVIAFGKIRVLETETEIRNAIEKLAFKYTPDNEEGCRDTIEKAYNRLCMMELEIEHMTGKEAIELVGKKVQK